MSLREKYLKVVSGIAPAGAVGISLLLGSTAPGAAAQDSAALQPQASDQARISERLAAIRDAVSTLGGEEAVRHGDSYPRITWWGNGGWGGGWGRPWGGWGWPNWNNWRNWNNWNNWWRNF
jgi:hypothetical protein